MNKPLKPCPFCGIKPYSEIMNKYLIIDCETADCLGPVVSSKKHTELRRKWNRRP